MSVKSAANTAVYNLLNSANSEARYNANSALYGGSSYQKSSQDAGNSALSSLSHNYKAFLTLLITQLKHQDPSSPMSNNSFTQELVQFASVEQQVESNSKLSSLISLNESGQMSSDEEMIGEHASAKSNSLPLQGGKAKLSFSGQPGQTAVVAIASPSGKIVRDIPVLMRGGQNTVSWDGKDGAGRQVPDGSYSIAVRMMDPHGNSVEVPTTVYGTITGVQKGQNDMNIQMGSATVPMNNLISVSKKGSPTRKVTAIPAPYKTHAKG